MEVRYKKGILAAILVAVIATIVIVPSFAAPASIPFQVATDKNSIPIGGSLRVIAFVKQAAPNCPYTVSISVTGPGGVSATDTITVMTTDGNGHAAAAFPADFSGVANTNTAGTYTVSATFVCGYSYSTAPATTTFTVHV